MMTELLCIAVPTESDVSVEQETRPRTVGKAIIAFVVGTLLSLAAWVSMQGWVVRSILLFGDFSRGNTWKHVLFSILGSLIISLTWCLSFRSCFRGDEDVEDLGELGFIFGYVLSGYLSVFHSNDFDKFLPLVIISWALLTLLRKYMKKEKRGEIESTNFPVGNEIV